MGKVAKDLNISCPTALRRWKYYEVEEYKNSEQNSSSKNLFTTEYNEYIKELLNNDHQLHLDNIIISDI